MGALLSYVASCFSHYPPKFTHVYGLEFPPVIHEKIDGEIIQKFKEVFVIGDVHGCYDEMMELLQKANATNDRVLKIFVGDLVNKGPKSCLVVNTIRNMKSAMAVRGNHDEVVLREYKASRNPSYQLSSGNQWMKDIPEDDISFLNKLPYTISIPSLNSIIVHAGLVPGLPLECHHPKDLVTMRNIKFDKYFDGKGLQPTSGSDGEAWAAVWPGPQHVYFGHDAKRMLQQHPYATGLDTGCVYGNHLTGIFINGPRTGMFVSVKAKSMHKTPGSLKLS